MKKEIYDIIGVGLGPFNISLAALSHPIQELKTLFFDRAPKFDWHKGMLIDQTTLQVPFLADMVTMIDPTSPLSYLNYIRKMGRMMRFYIKENFFVLRKEYNQYCKWVLEQLKENCHFGHEVVEVEYFEKETYYKVLVLDRKTNNVQTYFTKNIALGTGTIPKLPKAAKAIQHPNILHTAHYLYKKKLLLKQKSITIVGSGQSAAEVFYDLLQTQPEYGYQINWFTRSDRCFPLEYSKLTLEMTSTDYTNYFHALPEAKRNARIAQQNGLYKGVNFELINAIFDLLYDRSLDGQTLKVHMQPMCSLGTITPTSLGGFKLGFQQWEQEQSFEIETNAVILATGYKYNEPAFIKSLKDHIAWDASGRYAVHRNHAIDKAGKSLFIQNASLHTHSIGSPDLGMGATRNAEIINSILGKPHYPITQNTMFQNFEAPKIALIATV